MDVACIGGDSTKAGHDNFSALKNEGSLVQRGRADLRAQELSLRPVQMETPEETGSVSEQADGQEEWRTLG